MQNQTTQLKINIDQELKQQIQNIAKKSGQSIQNLVQDALSSFFVENRHKIKNDWIAKEELLADAKQNQKDYEEGKLKKLTALKKLIR